MPDFFIVGRGRSGTTLLKNLLNKNKNICIPPESLFFHIFQKKYFKKRFKKDVFINFIEDLNKDPRIKYHWHIDKEKIIKLYEKSNVHDYIGAVDLIYKFYGRIIEDKKKFLIGDKNPINSLFLNEINRSYKHCKIIIICRGIKENINSFKNVNFDLNNTYGLAMRWFEYNKLLFDYHNKNKNSLLIHYEDIIANSEKTIKTVSQFLNIEYNIDYDLVKNNYLENTSHHKNLKLNVFNNKQTKKFQFTKDEITFLNNVELSLHKKNTRINYPHNKKLVYFIEVLKLKMYNFFEKGYFLLPLFLKLWIIKFHFKRNLFE